MKNKLYMITSIAITILSFIHIFCTPLFYDSLSLGALWFLGTGLAFTFLGMLNFVGSRNRIYEILLVCLIGNILYLIYTVILTAKLLEIQAFFALFLILLMIYLNIAALLKSKKTNGGIKLCNN